MRLQLTTVTQIANLGLRRNHRPWWVLGTLAVLGGFAFAI
jgi:hypothetical protein